MDSQKGALNDNDYRNLGDASFSDNFQVSEPTNASSLATGVSDSADVVGVELVAGRYCSRSRARKYDKRWVICAGPHICKRTGHKEKGVMGKPGFYVVGYNKGRSTTLAS
jgi:hypothetical protein